MLLLLPRPTIKKKSYSSVNTKLFRLKKICLLVLHGFTASAGQSTHPPTHPLRHAPRHPGTHPGTHPPTQNTRQAHRPNLPLPLSTAHPPFLPPSHLLLARLGLANHVGECSARRDELLRVLDLHLLLLVRLDLSVGFWFWWVSARR